MHWDGDGNLRELTAEGDHGITKISEVAQAYIRSRMLMEFGLFALSALFLVVSALLAVFAPTGRETISSIIAAALLVVAIGSAGFTAFKFKIPLINVEASTHREGIAQSLIGVKVE
jgi:hypothetical protein